MKLIKYFLVISVLFTLSGNAQEITTPYTSSNKGKFYIYWGGNRGYYSGSDIRFQGADYDFTLNNVKAHDKPKGWHVDYINPTKMTIPQTNLRIGYFITDKYNVSLGVDHMKYVMTQNQEVSYSGNYPNQGSYGETLPNGNLKMTEEFLQFEHTDGLNYVNAEINRMDDFSDVLGLYDTDRVQFNTTYGVGAGILYPKTNTTLLGKERYDNFHVSGFGVSAKGGLNLTFFKHFFVQYEAKVGYINMNDVRTTHDKTDKASHNFTFFESIIVVGGIFRL